MPSSSQSSPQHIQKPEDQDLWKALLGAFLSHDSQTPNLLARMIAERPHDAMGPLVKGYMLLLLARKELRTAAEEALAEGLRRLEKAECTREAFYAAGLQSWLAGNPRGAISAMERVLDKHPLDAMAAKLSHSIRFMLGDADGMRRSLARIVSVYTDNVPHAGFIRGCYAFALEETGDYIEAEKVGRRAVALEPRDAWGRHAVAHVHEMTGQARAGLNWLSNSATWDHCNNFSFHMAWHIALFQLELGCTSEALAIYDTAIRAEKTDDFRDVANASSLLQRLELAGVPVGSRWEELADIAERRINDRQLAFADMHYILSLLGAGRGDVAETMVLGMMAEQGRAHNGHLLRDIAAPVAAGLVAFKAGRMAEAVSFLEPMLGSLQDFGGSHAQRDVFQQIYLEALVRSGGHNGEQLLKNRLDSRSGHNQFAESRLHALLQRSGHGQMAAIALELAPPLQLH